MWKPFQSLRLALCISASAAGLVGSVALEANAQERPDAPAANQAAPAPPAVLQSQGEDRTAHRPPDCLGCVPPPPTPPNVTPVRWTRQPVPVFPADAVSQGLTEGRVVLRCLATTGGLLADCAMISETPAGVGFGHSALAATADARLAPRTIDGAPADSVITFSVRFTAPPPEPVAPPPPR